MLKADYSIEIDPIEDEKGGGFFAYVKELPGCVSDGETADEAVLNVRAAIAEWIDCATMLGRPIPQPTRLYA